MAIQVRVHKEHEPPSWDRIVELARISMENPAAAAVLRLHRPGDLGHCEECGRLDGHGMRDTTWPCPTVQAIEQVAGRPKPILVGDAIRAQLADLDTGEIIRPKEASGGTA